MPSSPILRPSESGRNVFLIALALVYPVLIFVLLVLLHLPVRIISLCVILLAAALFIASGKGKGKIDWKPIVSSSLLLALGLTCFLTNRTLFLKLYPVAVSVTMLSVFALSLFFPPTVIFRFACLADKSIKGSLAEKQIESYCRKVCIVWCIFFICNGSVASYTAFFCSDRVWSVYNGGVSYVLMGLLFSIEYMVRRHVDKKMPKAHYISTFTADSRPDSHVLCYEGKWSDGVYKSWRDFLSDTAKMRTAIGQKDAASYLLHCEDYWYFLVTFIALLQCKKTVILTQNISASFIAEIKEPGMEFLTDQDSVPQSASPIFIPGLLSSMQEASEQEIRTVPSIEADETDILLYTSGSTGRAKAVRQRMTEFEQDNAFVISKWGQEFLSRKLVTTVSQHHIYGFLFGISLPFALGVPFRRKRIEYPEEFESLDDESYMIIATPAFLKRTVELEENLPLKSCFIFTSGGVLTKELAERTNSVFGFWPVEVYGSTETSGIAWRQSKDGLEWTPFDNARIWKNEEGCLVIVSPYIKDPEGFATGDLVDILDDGRFILNGRADSIVKVEEKRVSLTEIENRLLQTGLVEDVKVIMLEDRRQYLAAALVLNAEGRERFASWKKLDMNHFFHDYLMGYFENVVIPKKWRFEDKLPVDVQGKKHKEDIKALFTKSEATPETTSEATPGGTDE
ncbi:MAG: AMP-binding protein [Treponema sp.]|nr:AMP-binding protein [Treponema sp.]